MEIRKELTEINSYDLRLWEYAQSLMALRLKMVVPIVNEVKRELGLNTHRNTLSAQDIKKAVDTGMCSSLDINLTAAQKKSFGIVRPPGHKGPL